MDCRLVVTPTMSNSYRTHALVDTGCSGFAFMDIAHARTHNYEFLPLKKPRPLRGSNGVVSEYVTHYVRAPITSTGHHESSAFFYLTRLDYYAIILGLPWLIKHDVRIYFPTYTLTFDSPYCLRNCSHGVARVSGHASVPDNHRKTHGLPLYRPDGPEPYPRLRPLPPTQDVPAPKSRPRAVTHVPLIPDVEDAFPEPLFPMQRCIPQNPSMSAKLVPPLFGLSQGRKAVKSLLSAFTTLIDSS